MLLCFKQGTTFRLMERNKPSFFSFSSRQVETFVTDRIRLTRPIEKSASGSKMRNWPTGLRRRAAGSMKTDRLAFFTLALL